MGSIQSSIIRFLLRRSNIWNKSLNEVRKTMEGIKKTYNVPECIVLEKTELNGVDSEAFLHAVKKNDKVILYFHGGGFCLGIYNANREFVAKLAETSEMEFICRITGWLRNTLSLPHLRMQLQLIKA